MCTIKWPELELYVGAFDRAEIIFAEMALVLQGLETQEKKKRSTKDHASRFLKISPEVSRSSSMK
jgi:hypothetical protein